MQFFVFLTVILSIFACSFASESVGVYRDPAHPGKCVIDNLILSPGEEGKMKGDCGRIICGSEGFVTMQTCGVSSVEPPCKYGDYINIDAPYPDCCQKKIVCN